MGETVALYRVWDPSSVEHYLETTFPETRDFHRHAPHPHPAPTTSHSPPSALSFVS